MYQRSPVSSELIFKGFQSTFLPKNGLANFFPNMAELQTKLFLICSKVFYIVEEKQDCTASSTDDVTSLTSPIIIVKSHPSFEFHYRRIKNELIICTT
jgi:hypothetical protein